MKMIFYLAVALTIAISAGCKKQNNLSQVETTANAEANSPNISLGEDTLFIDVPPANPANPFDVYGAEHNRLLAATKPVWISPNSTTGDEYDALTPFFPLHDIGDTLPSKDEVIRDVAYIVADSGNGYANVLAGADLSDRGKVYVTALMNDVINLPQTDSFGAFIAPFIALEATVQNDASLSPSDKAALLKTAAIARYSSVFWINEFYAEANPSAGGVTGGLHADGVFGNVWGAVKRFARKVNNAVGSDLFAIATTGTIGEVAAASAAGYSR